MNSIRNFILSIMFLCFALSGYARVINVPNEFETIQGAINETQAGDTVLVLPGRYDENIRYAGQSIVVGSLFLTTGDEDFIGRTIIDGGNNGGSVVVFRNGEQGLFTGFTVQNGTTDYGGGFYIRGASPVLSHLIVQNNTVERNGAGIYCTQMSSPTINNVVIRNNSCGYVGGGFGCYGNSTPTLTNCQIYGNYSDHCGGGVHGYSSTLTLNRVTIANNRTLHTGGAIYLTQDAVANLTECILWENAPHEIQLAFANNVTQINISNSNIDGGRDEVELWDGDEANWVVGNIDQDPQFVNPDAGDYRLQEDSPCIDTGNPESDTDPDGTIADMGALYFHNENGRRALHVPDRFETINEAIDEAADGDIVLVQPGEYNENIDFSGKNITIGSRLISTGRDEFIGETVIDGGEEGSVVVFNNNETENAMLTGFTLTNGRAEDGGGVHIRGASPTLSNLIISQNNAGHGAGGIYCSDNSNPIITSCIIINNTSVDKGAGLVIANDSEPTIQHCVIAANSTGGNGAGIYCSSRVSPLFYNCTISGNEADNFGGGLYCDNNSHPTLVNSVLWGNAPQEVYFNGNREANTLTIRYSDITDGEDGVDINDNGELEWGEGIIDADPLFANVEEDDYHLTENSPCIDSGDPDSPLDPDDTQADMGAFYFHHVIERNPIIIHVPDDYELIQTAINMAQEGDTILVHPGTYVENLDFRGVNITLASHFIITGDPAYIDSTIIDGNENDAVVKFNSRENMSMRLIGFTVRNGSHPEGGGIYCFNSTPTISYCVIYGNQAESGGGGVFCYNSSPYFYNCTIVDNTVEEGGGAIFMWSSSFARLVNTIIRGNEPNQIFFGTDRDQSSIYIDYSDIEGGEDDIVLNGNGYVNWDDSNIDEDPRFADADNNDYRLTGDSPCIDTGDPDSPEDMDHSQADMGALFFGENLNPILLESGWNLISSYVEPPDDDMWIIWSYHLTRGYLSRVKDHFGRFLWPKYDYNNIPGWDVSYGYQVKMNRASRLYIVGEPLGDDRSIPLPEGWSIAAYYPEQETPVQEALSNIEDQLIFAKDGEGHFYWPEYDFSSMEVLHRGQGYQLYVSEAVELVWNVPDRAASADYCVGDSSTLVHFSSVAHTGCNMSILILNTDATNNEDHPAQGGFEVGVFTKNGLCVGAGVITENEACGVAVWGDDPTTDEIDGALEKDQLSFLSWNGTQESELQTEWIEGNGTYLTDGFAVVSHNAVPLVLPLTFGLEHPYPNPFNSMTMITYSLPIASQISLQLYNLTGREVATLFEGCKQSGKHRSILTANNLPSGLYFVRLDVSGQVLSKKIVLVK
ncbi:MAG: right-handed parallel beta-helix repeat-containing protein [Calditrichaeota bacterium]|nr:right-handed parallel beta-helix repeat-containing protein [Calditrichota bacterium]